MKSTFFRPFIRQADRSINRPSNRTLSVEPLEDRTLLATWGGFEGFPDTAVYQNDSAVIELTSTVDLIQVSDINGDGCDDIVTVNYQNSTVSVYLQQGASNRGYYLDAKVSAITVGGENLLYDSGTGGFAATLADFNGDNIADLLVVKQDIEGSTTLTLRLFAGDSAGNFVLSKTSSVSLAAFGSTVYSDYSVSFLEMVRVGDDDVAIHAYGLIANTSVIGAEVNIDTTVRYNNDDNNIGSFVSAGTNLGISGEKLIDSMTIDGCNFLVTQQSNDKLPDPYSYKFYSANAEASPIFYYDSGGESYSIKSPVWTAISGDTLYYASDSKLVAIHLDYANGTVSRAGSKSFDISGATFGNFSQAVVGSLDGDAVDDLICVTGTNYAFFHGEEDTGSDILNYEQKTVIANPSYLASWVGNWNGSEAVNDLIVAGAYGMWVYAGGDLDSEPTQLAVFSQKAEQVIFGNFGSTSGAVDSFIDVAVLFGDKVGFFVQDGNGGFASNAPTLGSFYVTFSSVPDGEAKAPMMVVGDILGKDSDQIVIYYNYSNEAGPSLAFIDPQNLAKNAGGSNVSNQSFEIDGGYTVSSLAIGKLDSSDSCAALLYSVAKKGSDAAKLFILESDGTTLSEEPAIELELPNDVTDPVSVALAYVNDDDKSDIVLLDRGTGALDASLCYLLQGSAVTDFTATKVGMVDEVGEVGGLILTDISGDNLLDAVFTVTKTDGKSKTFVALGRTPTEGDENTFLFKTPENYYLLGDYSGGIDFLSESEFLQSVPFLSVTEADADGFRSLYMVKGKTVALLTSVAVVEASGNVCFAVRGADTTASGNALSQAEILSQGGVYEWVDEWSRFYIEIWGTADAEGKITEFKTEISFNPNNFEYSGTVEAGGVGDNRFDVSVDSSTSGRLVVTGYSDSVTGVPTGKLVLLARVLMSPYGNGGINLDNSGVFQGEAFGVTASAEKQSINRSQGVKEGGVTSNFDDLILYPVRYDFNDDGRVNSNDFIDFALYYSTVPVGKYQIFDFDTNSRITSDDFIDFALGYGGSLSTTSTRFYDEIGDNGKDPTDWWQPESSGSLTADLAPAEGAAIAPAAVSSEYSFVAQKASAENKAAAADECLICVDSPESDFLEINAIDALAAEQAERVESGNEIPPIPVVSESAVKTDGGLTEDDETDAADEPFDQELETALDVQ